MGSLPAANVLPLIESHFAFVIAEFGFELAQSTEIPSIAWFRQADRVVIVAYDFIRDASVNVDLVDESADERYALGDVLAFEGVLAPRAPEGVRERGLVVAEIERLARILANYGREFLQGDLEGFRRRYREALLVRGTRAAALREFYEGDPVRAKALFEAMRAYWDDRDREHVALLASGTRLRHLRRGD